MTTPLVQLQTPGGAVRGRDLRAPLRLTCDVVVVGSGAGGAMLARDTARAGLATVLIEEGGFHGPGDFTQREGEMLPRLFQEAGGRSTEDGAVMILSGKGVGGSTVHNTNLCKRAPDAVLKRWVAEHGAAGFAPEELAADYQAVEDELHVAPMTEEDVNRNNQLMRQGVQKLGWRGGLLSHNRRGCQRSGFCELGCVYNAKENALKLLVPDALRLGAQVYSEVRITQILRERERAIGVRGHVLVVGQHQGAGRQGLVVDQESHGVHSASTVAVLRRTASAAARKGAVPRRRATSTKRSPSARSRR